ncbi:hypothetical protein [Halobaculum sp. D14]|uniref:hypothetical protein n=1 Tax=Halobaculum sp. D14 TaxID=3421642 RepID=UPI003EBA7F76
MTNFFGVTLAILIAAVGSLIVLNAPTTNVLLVGIGLFGAALSVLWTWGLDQEFPGGEA